MAEEASTQIQRNQTKRRRLPPRSGIWDHFRRETDGHGKEIATCKHCGKVYAYHGTTNLKEHYPKGCVGQEASADAGVAEQQPQALSISSLAQDEEDMQQHPPLQHPSSNSGSSVRESSGGLQEEASQHLARMIALGGYDASVLEDDHFRSFVRRLNPEFEVPSRVAIENMCDGILDEAKRDVLGRLRRAPGKVNVAVGRAKAMDEDVLYVACHFIDDGWNLHNPLLHAFVTTVHHDVDDGPILGFDVSCTYQTDDDVRQVILDHGIFAHVDDDDNDSLFMVAYETTDKDICPANFGRGMLCTNPNRICATYVDNVLHSIARCLLPDDKFTAKVFGDVESLSLTRQERLELFAELDLHYRWASDEHWYALYCSLQVASYSMLGFCHMRTDAELVTANLLRQVWEKIYRAIQKISSSTGPTANLCLAELFKLRGVLQPEVARLRKDPPNFHVTFNEGKNSVTDVFIEASNTLDKAIQDSYLAWSLPLVLDPRYKLKYIAFNFKRAYGLEAAKEYISEVTTMMRDLYSEYVEEYGTTNGADDSVTARAMDTTTSADDQMEQAWNEHCRSQQGTATETELDRYLEDRLASHNTEAEGFDILNWWKAHSSEYPMVARMARDALAMPTCSKLSSYQMAQLRSILRGYSKDPYRAGKDPFEL